MNISEILTALFTGIGLAMDAVAASVANGISLRKMRLIDAVRTGFFFGFFQFAMPLIGFFISGVFDTQIRKYDHIVALILLCFLGSKMIFEAVREMHDEQTDKSLIFLSTKTLFLQAIATSIDALAVGVTYSVMGTSSSIALTNCIIIGICTFLLSALGMFLGKKLSRLFRHKASIIGGIILILIGVKIFIFDVFSL